MLLKIVKSEYCITNPA